jgi:hypothetical protein
MIQSLCCLLLAWGAAEGRSHENRLGPVTVTTRLAPDAPVIGDEITLEIRVEAEPDIEVFMPAFGEALHRYTIVDFLPRHTITDSGQNEYVQRYTLQPQESGDQTIPPILIEFLDHRPGQKLAPDDLDAYELLTDRIDFHVQSVLPDAASAELHPPLGRLESVPRAESRRRNWLLGGGFVVVLAAALLVVWLRVRRLRVRRRNAYELARARLDALLAQGPPRDPAAIEAFFVAISGIVRRYLEDRFELRAPELTTEEFLAVAGTSPDLTRDHQTLLREFLRQADLVKFAGVHATANEVGRSSDSAVRFLEETRANAPLVDAGPSGARSHQAPHAAASRDDQTRWEREAEKADV